MKVLFFSFVFLSLVTFGFAQESQYPAIIEKLGEKVPLENIHFFDENGKEGTLKDFGKGKPIVLALAFFQCRSICTPFINGVGEYVDENKGSMQAGKDFALLTISFNHDEKFDMAADKKKSQFDAMRNKRPGEAWQFLTGDKENIAQLTNKVGFKFVEHIDEFGGKDYRHKSGLIILSPEGKIVRYLEGDGDMRQNRKTYFNAFEMDLAISEAYKGISGPSFAKFLNVCFKFEPKNKQYTLKVLQIAGALITLSALALFLSITVLSKKPKVVNDPNKKEGSE